MKNEYDANNSGFTFAPSSKPVIKRTITLCDRLKRIKLISVFKFVGIMTGVIVALNLTIELIGTLR
tara:strand:- start:7866 stop:8063 length:198 start_codon:yes stop_codon:yes gene_type:complete